MHLPRWQFLANKCPYAKRRKHFSKQFAFATWNEKIIEIPAEMFLHSSKHLKVRTTAMKNRTILSKRTRLKRHFWFVDEKLWVLSSGLRKVSNEIQWTIRWYETVSFVRISFSLFFLSTKEETRKRTREFMNVNSDFISADIVGSEFRIPRRRKFVNGVICTARGET